MLKTLIKVSLIYVLISLSSGCAEWRFFQSSKPVATIVIETPDTMTISVKDFQELKDNVTKLGQDAQYYQQKYNDCLKNSNK